MTQISAALRLVEPTGRREAASEGSMIVSVVQAAGVAWAVFAERCPAVIPHLPRLIFGPCGTMALPMGCSREAAWLLKT
jgi:hypothetical protein